MNNSISFILNEKLGNFRCQNEADFNFEQKSFELFTVKWIVDVRQSLFLISLCIELNHTLPQFL
uniref:Putative ovule protein n=1 Tax=Solanum chacoense TaxID=4108 RepID=A0A0V0GZK4_SOLCH